jgi:phage terminase large subunit GpA-like protein
MAVLANPRQIASEAIAAALEPPPPIDLLAFAEGNVSFEEGQFKGPYNRAFFPFADEILRALSPSDSCRIVTVMSSAQCSKTTIGNIFALACMMYGRGTTMYLHPTIENAQRWAKAKLSPLMRSTAGVKAEFPERSSSSRTSLLFKERRDGLSRLLISGANSPASLSQVTANSMERRKNPEAQHAVELA